MAKNSDKSQVPSCPHRAPPVTLARTCVKQSKQATRRRGDGEEWPGKRDLRGGYHPSGAREVAAAGKPIKAEVYEMRKTRKAG